MSSLNRSQTVKPKGFALLSLLKINVLLCLALFVTAASHSAAEVTFNPAAPEGCVPVTITYDGTGRNLEGEAVVFIHIGRNDWQDVVTEPMDWSGGETWTYTFNTPADTYEINLVFTDSLDLWDDNDGAEWSLSFTNCGIRPPPAVTFDPAEPVGCVPVTITYDATGRVLADAEQVFIHMGRNDWQDVIEPNPAMTSRGNGVWEFTFNVPGETTELNMVFNDGAGIWDNNNGRDWAISIADCGFIPPGPPARIAFSTPARTVTAGVTSDLITVQLRDENNRETTSENATTVALSTDRPGAFRNADDTANITSVTIAAGQSSSSFRYAPSSLGAHVLTASHPTLTDATQNFMVLSTTPGAQVYTDSVGDTFTTAGGGILDIVSVEVSNTETELLFKINLAGNPIANDWGKYMIGFDTSPGGSTTSNGWGRPISMSSGMNSWVGTWVDGGNGAQIWTWNGTGWNLHSQSGGVNPGNISISKDTSSVSIRLDFASLGLTLGENFSFDIYTSGGGGGDGAIDALANPNQTISAWGQAYNSGSLVVQYTLTQPSTDPWQNDSNNDGIPDGWYLQYGFDPQGPSIADLDSDGDGFTNRQEFLLGTNPTDPNSRFRATIGVNSSGHRTVTWTSVGGRTYAVDYTNELNLGFTQAAVVTENAVADGVATTRTFVDDGSQTGGSTTTNRRFYRVRLVVD